MIVHCMHCNSLLVSTIFVHIISCNVPAATLLSCCMLHVSVVEFSVTATSALKKSYSIIVEELWNNLEDSGDFDMMHYKRLPLVENLWITYEIKSIYGIRYHFKTFMDLQMHTYRLSCLYILIIMWFKHKSLHSFSYSMQLQYVHTAWYVVLCSSTHCHYI